MHAFFAGNNKSSWPEKIIEQLKTFWSHGIPVMGNNFSTISGNISYENI
jgi:hypothetical protein